MDWKAIAAFAALALSAYNFAYGLREPVRARQREVRHEVLDLLYELQNEWLKISSVLARGASVTDAPKSREVLAMLINYSMLLRYPGKDDFLTLKRDLSSGLHYIRVYGNLKGADPDHVMNRLEPAEVLASRLGVAIKILSDKERGSLRRPRVYPSYPKLASYREERETGTK